MAKVFIGGYRKGNAIDWGAANGPSNMHGQAKIIR